MSGPLPLLRCSLTLCACVCVGERIGAALRCRRIEQNKLQVIERKKHECHAVCVVLVVHKKKTIISKARIKFKWNGKNVLQITQEKLQEYKLHYFLAYVIELFYVNM